MAEEVAEGLSEAGYTVTLHNTNKTRYPIEEYPDYDLIAIGTPDYFSYMAGTIKTFLDDWYLHRNDSRYTGKPFVLFMSHGGGGRAKDTLSVFNRIGVHKGSIVSSSGSPSKQVLEQCRELGKILAKP